MDGLGTTQSLSTANNGANAARFEAVQRQLNNFETQAAASGLDQETIDRINETAKEFEAVFLSEMLTLTFKDVSFDPSSQDSGSSQDVYKSFMLQEYGKVLAERGGVGLAESVRTELLDLQTRTSNQNITASADAARAAYNATHAPQQNPTQNIETINTTNTATKGVQ